MEATAASLRVGSNNVVFDWPERSAAASLAEVADTNSRDWSVGAACFRSSAPCQAASLAPVAFADHVVEHHALAARAITASATHPKATAWVVEASNSRTIAAAATLPKATGAIAASAVATFVIAAAISSFADAIAAS